LRWRPILVRQDPSSGGIITQLAQKKRALFVGPALLPSPCVPDSISRPSTGLTAAGSFRRPPWRRNGRYLPGYSGVRPQSAPWVRWAIARCHAACSLGHGI